MTDSSPVIPLRTSLRPREQHRRSLPSSTITAPRRSANRVTIQPASTEVISSLIETLSAISTPAEHHFENLPRITASVSTPSSPRYNKSHGPFGGYVHRSGPDPGFGMDYGVQKKPRESAEDFFLHPDDVAHPPVVPTSPGQSFFKSHFRNVSWGSQTHAERDPQQEYSIGNLSIEPGPQQSETSIASTASGGKKSIKTYKTLGFRSSKDRMSDGNRLGGRMKSREHLPDAENQNPNLEGTSSPDPLMIFESQNSENLDLETLRFSARGSSAHSSIYTTNQHPKSPRVSARASSAHSSIHATNQEANRPVDSPDIVGSGLKIPTRDSSVRHSHGSSPSRRKRRSHVQPDIGRLVLDDSPDLSKKESQKFPDDSVEDDVSRRIRELKEQKRRRESPLTVTTEDSRSPSSSRQGKYDRSPLRQTNNLTTNAKDEPQNSPAKRMKQACSNEDYENSAPSPVVDQRINRISGARASSQGCKPREAKNSSLLKPTVEIQRTRSKPPQRSNSRLLKRSTSPTTAEKHRRTFSNPLAAEDRSSSLDSIDDGVYDYLSSPRLSQKIEHPTTGRVISFSEVGDPNGLAVFCCVGMGLTRYITAFYDELALTLKLRLITPDRPGVGASEPHVDGTDQPLRWPDDVLAICQHLKLSKFSILAHSAGAIYALATALRMPQHIRGRVHLLAPWIPPSQMSVIGTQQDSLPVSAMPYSQRFLRSLPTTFLKAANSNFFSTTSASITTSLPKSPRRSRRKSMPTEAPEITNASRREYSKPTKVQELKYDRGSFAQDMAISDDSDLGPSMIDPEAEKERQSDYDTRLTEAIWAAATTNANPAVDLLVCLERRQSIGFRYVDITRSVVIHHGSKDTRVPVENAKWLGKTMRRCEVRVLDGEGHGLMASAGVMGSVLMEMAREWEDWITLVQGKGGLERARLDRRVTSAV